MIEVSAGAYVETRLDEKFLSHWLSFLYLRQSCAYSKRLHRITFCLRGESLASLQLKISANNCFAGFMCHFVSFWMHLDPPWDWRLRILVHSCTGKSLVLCFSGLFVLRFWYQVYLSNYFTSIQFCRRFELAHSPTRCFVQLSYINFAVLYYFRVLISAASPQGKNLCSDFCLSWTFLLLVLTVSVLRIPIESLTRST